MSHKKSVELPVELVLDVLLLSLLSRRVLGGKESLEVVKAPRPPGAERGKRSGKKAREDGVTSSKT